MSKVKTSDLNPSKGIIIPQEHGHVNKHRKNVAFVTWTI